MTQGEMNAPPISTGLSFSEREEQIMEVAWELLLKWGYNRITMEDISRYAGIGKGTLYLHWKSREALFQTLLLREALAVWRDLMERVRQEPNEMRYSRLMRAMYGVVMQRPLAKALFMGDMELLGKLAGGGNNQRQQAQQVAGAEFFITTLRDHGLIRNDTPLPQQLYAMQATISGFFMLDPALLDNSLSIEERADVLAQTIQRAFEPEMLPATATIEKVATTLVAWMEQTCTQYEEVIRGLMT